MYRIGLCTPARNEEKNIAFLYDELKKYQNLYVVWYIIENDSVDRTYDVVSGFKNTDNLKIYVEKKDFHDEYNVGVKYSVIVNYGMEKIKKIVDNDVYIGICDSDCLPKEEYFIALINAMKSDSRLVLTSGYGVMNGEYDGEGVDHVRGNCRIWRPEYISQYKFPLHPSPDSISKFEAELDGYSVYPTLAFYKCRELGGAQNDFTFYGYSAAYRGVSMIFVFVKTIRLLLKNVNLAWTYMSGYLKNKFILKQVYPDNKFRRYVYRRSLESLKNYHRIQKRKLEVITEMEYVKSKL